MPILKVVCRWLNSVQSEYESNGVQNYSKMAQVEDHNVAFEQKFAAA